MHIKNLLANSAIQNMITQQQKQQQQSQPSIPQSNPIPVNTLPPSTVPHQQQQTPNNQIIETAKIRKRKNNSQSNKLIIQQKENTDISNNTNQLINNAELNASKLFEKFKSMPIIQMSQPNPNTGNFSVGYPGKHHSVLLKKSNNIKGAFFSLEIDHIVNNSGHQMDKKFIDYILNENEIFADEKKELSKSLCLNQLGANKLKNCFKMCTAKIEKPPLVEIDKNNVPDDSKHRLVNILDHGKLNYKTIRSFVTLMI